MLIDSIYEEYFDYLCDILRCDLPEHRHYSYLLHDLSDKEFVWSVDLDKNRYMDAIDLRRDFLFERYEDDEDIYEDLYRRYSVNCLEVLTAFSRRIETDITGEPGNEEYEKWFWIMISNLGLDRYDDYHYNVKKVNEILDIWLTRRFNSNGKDGIFPIQNSAFDQREIDMWHQMNNYLVEKYPV